jgi:hypothetical protein
MSSKPRIDMLPTGGGDEYLGVTLAGDKTHIRVRSGISNAEVARHHLSACV